jgi:hypothetical protein
VATPVCGLRCTTPASELTPPPLSARWNAWERDAAARDDLAGGGLHGGSGGWSARCAYGASSGCWARRALERARGRCARPSPAWARRRRGDGAEYRLAQGATVRRGRRARGCAHASGYSCWGVGLGSRRGVAVVHGGARLGAMGGGEHGARGRLTSVRACVVRSGKGRSWRPRNRCPSSWRLRARLARPRQGRGDVGTLEGGSEGRRKRRGSKARPCPQMGVRVCWGAPRRKGVGPARSRARARTWPRRGVAVTSGTTRHTTATRNKQASERARVDEGSGSCKKFHPSLA